jgi:hypothetical protein
MSPANGVSWLGGTGGAIQTWQIASQGNVAGIRNAQVQVVMNIERSSTPLFTYAIFAQGTTCGAINLSAGSNVDSYNSSNGTYSATHVNSGGNIGSDGNTTIAGSTVVYGTVSTPKTGSSTSACSSASPDALTGTLANTGGIVAVSAITYPTPPAPSPLPPSTKQDVTSVCGTMTGCSVASGVYTLAPNKSYGDVIVPSGHIVHVSAGTYTINSITLSGGAQFIVDSGPVIVNVAGQINASGQITSSTVNVVDFSGGSIANSTGIPSNVQFVYGGSNPITLSGGSTSGAVVYAPNSNLTISGSGGVYGAMIGKTVTDSGGSAVHYDTALANSLVQTGAYYPTSFSWSKF